MRGRAPSDPQNATWRALGMPDESGGPAGAVPLLMADADGRCTESSTSTVIGEDPLAPLLVDDFGRR